MLKIDGKWRIRIGAAACAVALSLTAVLTRTSAEVLIISNNSEPAQQPSPIPVIEVLFQNAQPPAASPGAKPNILVIFGDDIGTTNISAFSDGLMGYETPNIDRIAKEGLRFLHTRPDGAMTPFRSEKNTNWEGAFRVPCVVRWPGHIKPGTITTQLMSHNDWIPTQRRYCR